MLFVLVLEVVDFVHLYIYIGVYDWGFELLIWMSIYGYGYGGGYVGLDELLLNYQGLGGCL